MMADDNLSSSPSPAAESQPRPEEEPEEKVPGSGGEPKQLSKAHNGVAHSVDASLPDTNANHLQECNGSVAKECNGNVVRESNGSVARECNGIVVRESNGNVVRESNGNVVRESNGNVVRESNVTDADQENNNSADSLEEVVAKTVAKTDAEQAPVVDVDVGEAQTSVLVETLVETASKTEETLVAVEASHTEDVVEVSEKAAAADDKPDVKSEAESVQEAAAAEKTIVVTSEEETIMKDYREKLESMAEKMVLLDVKSPEDDEDGFVPVEACLPKDEDPDQEVDLPTENFDPSSEEPEIAPSANGFGESLPLSPVSSTASDKSPGHPEIEQFVKSGGVKRIIPGVQKTEQPYSTCTTETKIAMEIREMREREEELRIMREQALQSPAASPVPPKTPSTPSMPSSTPSPKEGPSPVPPGPGYRVSSVFGHRPCGGMPSVLEDKKVFGKAFSKESAVEKEIRMAKDREEELRRLKGLPPREDDSYVKPSEVKSSQVRVFGKAVGSNSNAAKQAATAKIQMEIEEQTQREMALRETGHIQTISQERTDAKVAKLKTAETHAHTNGNTVQTNGTHANGTNGHSSPDYSAPYKRSSPSPTNARPASIFAPSPGLNKGSISMHKFISSKGKETSYNSTRNGPFVAKEDTIGRPAVPPAMVKLKRNVSVESKIQQEILEMKQREEELRKLHMTMTNGKNGDIQHDEIENGHEDQMNQKNSIENGMIPDEEISPRHNRLIAQWEQMIQKAES